MSEPLLVLEEVLAARGPSFRLAVRHLAVARGAALAIVGRSGSGKSTGLDLMAGVLRPTAARRFEFRAKDDGPPVSLGRLWAEDDQSGLRELRGRQIGYVLQTGGLVPFLTIRDNVELPLLRNGRTDRAHVGRLLARLGLTGLGSRKPRQVSIGQRQRAAVARALAHRPALVLADEPTASLDPDTAETVMALLTEAVRETGAALVLVTHDADLARRHGLRTIACEIAAEPGLSVIDDRVRAC